MDGSSMLAGGQPASQVEFQLLAPDEFERDPTEMSEIHLDPTTGRNERHGAALASEGGFLEPAIAQRLPPSSLPQGWERTSRNAMCPCGSGKKFKHCHGALV
jgi:preprotein translocase subunit SecA